MTTACIIADSTQPTLAYAAKELRSFLERTTDLVMAEPEAKVDCRFVLEKKPGMGPACHAVRVARQDGLMTVALEGDDEACVLHAVYALLEACGVWFDILGPLLPDRVDLEALPAGTHVTTPFVRTRGIRQHINFAMDISSYPLAEAREYVRNMARMRMNHITFHSYSGQWFGYMHKGEYRHGGRFFYGTRFAIPDRELFTRNICNRSVYCIPEIEEMIDQPVVRSRMATEWLRAVMAECTRCGIHIQLSIEPPGGTHEEGVAICREVIKLYPAIDTLELITPECGNSERCLTVAELKTYLAELFGDSVGDDAVIQASLKDDLHQLEGGLRNCARNIRIVNELRAAADPTMPALAIGAYITCPDTLRVLHAVMQRYTPEGVTLAFLPSHGARRAVVNLRQAGFSSSSMMRSMLYGWIEFDGNMYLQQNSVVGARQLLEFAKEFTGEAQVPGVALNHWRTAENRTCIAYAAKAFLQGPIDPAGFYREYARAFGVRDEEHYARIMQELDDLDDLARNKMFNIGFCASGCWVRPGLRWTKQWDSGAIDDARHRFQAVCGELERCLQSATKPAGRALLRFLVNRVACTVIHLECAQMMKGLGSFCDHEKPDSLDAGQKQAVAETCARALALAERYMERHADAIADRGCEGMLISYQTTIPVFIDHIRAVFVEGEAKCRHLLPEIDAPPPPMAIGS